MDTAEIFHAISYIKRSKNRFNIVKYLYNHFRMPKEIADNLSLEVSHISSLLNDLKEENIIYCVNEHDKNGRLYMLTDLGTKAYDLIEKNDKN